MQKIYNYSWINDMGLLGYIDDNNLYAEPDINHSYDKFRGCVAGENDFLFFQDVTYGPTWEKAGYMSSSGYLWPASKNGDFFYVYRPDSKSRISEMMGCVNECHDYKQNFHGFVVNAWRATEGGWSPVAYTNGRPSTVGAYLVLEERIHYCDDRVYYNGNAWVPGKGRSEKANTRFFWDIDNGKWIEQKGTATWRESKGAF